jgi:hypothetical protein
VTRLAQDALSATGKDEPVTILQPFLVLNFCIALDGIFPASRDRRERRVVVTNEPAMPPRSACAFTTNANLADIHVIDVHSIVSSASAAIFSRLSTSRNIARHRPPARRGGGGPHADEVHSDNRICTKRHYQC